MDDARPNPNRKSQAMDSKETVRAIEPAPPVVSSFSLVETIAEVLAKGDQSIWELGEIRATLLVNFGEGKVLSHICNLGSGDGESTGRLLIRTLEALILVRP